MHRANLIAFVSVLLNCPAMASVGSSRMLSDGDSTVFPKNAVHLEAWGISSVASINYERTLIRSKNWCATGRAGIGTIHFRDFTRRFNPDLVMPFGTYFCYGRKAQAEVGGGGAVTSIVYPEARTFDPQRIQRLHGWCSLGIRAGEPAGRLFARAALNVLFEFGRTELTAGLGLGYRF